jgi:hypothetical protein
LDVVSFHLADTRPQILGATVSAMPTAYRLTHPDGSVVESDVPGLLGGNRRLKIYGRLDCASALRALSRGYTKRRVFFADEAAAIAAGYRPCAVCMPAEYRRWKAAPKSSESRA